MTERIGPRWLVPAAFWLGLLAALLALWRSGQAEDAWQVVREARLVALPLVLLLGVALPVIHAIRWRAVMAALDQQIPPLLAADLTVSASLVNYAGPGYLGAPAKAFLANRTAGTPYPRSLLSMAFEQGLDFLVLLAGSVLALALLGPDNLSSRLPDLGRTTGIALAVLLPLMIIVLLTAGRDRIVRAAKRIGDAFRALGGRVDWRIVGGLTLAYWLAQAAVVGLLLWALRLPGDLTTLLALATLPLLVGQLAPLPGGIGAREAAIVALAGATGAGATGLLGLAILQRVLLVAALPLSLGVLRVGRKPLPPTATQRVPGPKRRGGLRAKNLTPPLRVGEGVGGRGLRGQLALIVLVGVAIRLVVMPFTLHFDAYQIYSRAHEAAYHNDWFGFTSQFIIQTVHNLWLLIVRPLMPDSAAIWSETASTIGVGASREDYERFLAYDHLYRAIFLMKLPYVAADLTCGWLLTRLVPAGRRVAVAAFWLLNPLVIFSSAIYGRHDSLAILLVLLSIVAVRRATDAGRLAGLALLGVATLTRFFPVVVVPLFLLAFRRSQRQLTLFLGLLAGMVALVELTGYVTSGESTILTILDSYEHFEYWFDAGLYLRFDDWIFLFPVAYLLGLLWLSERGLTPAEYPPFAAAAFLLLFSLTFFHPHYAIWLVPFLALTIPLMVDSRRLTIYHAIQVACVLIYSAQWGSWTTWDILEPLLGNRVASLPDPVEALDAQIEPRLFFGLFRSLLTAVSLWLAWRILRPVVRRERG